MPTDCSIPKILHLNGLQNITSLTTASMYDLRKPGRWRTLIGISRVARALRLVSVRRSLLQRLSCRVPILRRLSVFCLFLLFSLQTQTMSSVQLSLLLLAPITPNEDPSHTGLASCQGMAFRSQLAEWQHEGVVGGCALCRTFSDRYVVHPVCSPLAHTSGQL